MGSGNSTCDGGASDPSRFDSSQVQRDPDLAALVDAWQRLPEPVRAGIVAMVKAAGISPS